MRRFLQAALWLVVASTAFAATPDDPHATSGDAHATSRDAASLHADAPVTASYRPGLLVLRFGGDDEQVWMGSSWPVEDASAGNFRFRAVHLDLLDRKALESADLPATRPITIRPRQEWDDLVTQVLLSLAPTAKNEVALTQVQGQEIEFSALADHAVRLQRHEAPPGSERTVRVVGEGEFAAQADKVLRARFGDNATLLFRSGDDADDQSFVFFDLARRESVLIAGPDLGQRSDLGNFLNMLVRVPDTVIVRGQAFGVLTRPVSSAARLVWLVSQSALKLVPPHYDSHDGPPPPVAARPGMDLQAWERELDSMGFSQSFRGSATPLIGGEAFFKNLVQTIQAARKSISIRLFIFDNDDYAVRIADLLKQRSQQIHVRVLIDALGSLGAAQNAPEGAETRGRSYSIVRYLREGSNVQVRQVPNALLVSDHTKTILVDRRVAYVGGMNIGHEYRHEWHDMMVALEGPIVGRLQHDFDTAWNYAGLRGDLAYVSTAGSETKFSGDQERPDYVDLRPLYTRTFDPQVLRAQVAAMRRARHAIWIEQPYVSDDTLVAALIEARARGVDVRLIVPTRGDSHFMNSANLLAASLLVRNGVRVYIYPGMTHVKAAIYDGWACIGSANFDKLSLRVNRETNIATSAPAFVDRLRHELFEADFARSRELTEPPAAGWGTYITAYVARQL